jgi:hypothetical protein
MQSSEKPIDFIALLVTSFIALLGGIAKQLSDSEAQFLKRKFFSGLFISMFTGILIGFILPELDISPNWGYALSGVAGWASTEILDAAAKVIKKWIEKKGE